MKRICAVLAVCLVAAAGCDETRVRTGPRGLTTLEQDAARVLVSAEGIGRLVEIENPGGFPLVAAAQPIRDSPDVTLGPLEQLLAVKRRTSTPSTAAVSLTTELDGATIFVPARIALGGGEVRICRWRVQATEIATTAALALVGSNGGQEFGVTQVPQVVLEGATVTPIDDCADIASRLPDNFEELLVTYLREALAESAALSLPAAPLDILGLLRGNVQLTRTSPFANHSGTLAIEADVSPRPGALGISADGLSVLLDATAEADRARCAPPTAIEAAAVTGTQPLDPAGLRQFGADFALAVSTSWLSRVAQGATLAGYACRGLEDPRRPEINEDLVPTADVLLDELGLDGLPLGPYASLTLAPGTLPRLAMQPSTGTVRVDWQDLQVEVYGEVHGARTRLVRVVADTVLGLRPVGQVVGIAKFELESIDVTTDRIDSEFFQSSPPADQVDRWVRRTLLGLLEERFEFPLPLAPASPVRVVSVQVRANDLVTFMRFD